MRSTSTSGRLRAWAIARPKSRTCAPGSISWPGSERLREAVEVHLLDGGGDVAMTIVAKCWTPGFSGADLLAARLAEPCSTAGQVAAVGSRLARVDSLDMRLPIETRAQPSKPMANRHS